MNTHDSERIFDVLEPHGYAAEPDAASADVMVVNTCSVREKAEHKLFSMLGRLRDWKEAQPGRQIAVAGCVASHQGSAIIRRAPWVDVVFGPDRIHELPVLLAEVEQGAPPRVAVAFDYDAPTFLSPVVDAAPTKLSGPTAFVTVMKGCDERCTFCIVPYTRGSERYRPAADIVEECKHWVRRGVREITLLGQTVNSWHEPLPLTHDAAAQIDAPTSTQASPAARVRGSIKATSHFAQLLHLIAEEVPELLRLRYTSPHPRHVTDALLEAYHHLAVLPDHVHLPVQSGSNRMLRRMLRRYTRAEYMESIAALRRVRPNMTFSTDIIVGFPGETDADFAETLSLVQEVGYASVYAFKYSPRPHTPALNFEDVAVAEEVKEARLATLFEVADEVQARHLASLVGAEVDVLIESRGKGDEGLWQGRSQRHEIVHLSTPSSDGTGIRDADVSAIAPGALVRARVEYAGARSVKAVPLALRVAAPVSVGLGGAPNPQSAGQVVAGEDGARGVKRRLPVAAAHASASP